MLRRLLSGAVIVAASISPVLAADLILDEEEMVVVDDDVFDWTGFYVGVQGGVAFANSHVAYREADGDVAVNGGGVPAEIDYEQFGGLLGVHAGVLGQFDTFVLGIEGDIAWTGLDGELVAFEPAFAGDDVEVNISALASLRAKAGIAVDRALIYVTAGVAAANQSTFGENAIGTFADYGGWVGGLTAGVGASFAATDNIIVTGEYRATVLAQQSGPRLDAAPCCGITSVTTDTVIHTGTLGVSLKF
jgi:outer membrane immunogenic protein